MDKKIKILLWSVLGIIFCLSLAANIFLYNYSQSLIAEVESRKQTEKIMQFRNMFTENVLLSDNEVSFETRLALENTVRALNNKEIFSQWESFVNSQTQAEASVQAKKLLKLLIEKTSLY